MCPTNEPWTAVWSRRLATIFLLASLTEAHAANEVVWLMPDFAPNSIKVDGMPSDGMVDLVTKYIVSKWPDATHSYLYANGNRTWSMIANGDHDCNPAAILTPERRKLAYITLAYILPPLQLVARIDMANALDLNDAGEIDLPLLLGIHQFKGLIPANRSYGPIVDNMISRRPADSSLTTYAPSDYGENILQMIAIKRVDYTLMYDYELNYLAGRDPTQLASLRAIPINDNNALVVAGIACPRTPWGRAAIERIDGIIGTKEGAKVLHHAVESWLTQAGRTRYSKAMDNFYLARARPSNPADF